VVSLLQATLLGGAPANRLQPLGSIQLPAGARDVAFDGDRAYAIGSSGISVMDVRNSQAPAILGGATGVDFRGQYIAARNGLAYCTAKRSELSAPQGDPFPEIFFVVDAQSPDNLHRRGGSFLVDQVFGGPLPSGVRNFDGGILVGTESGGVNWVNVANPVVPTPTTFGAGFSQSGPVPPSGGRFVVEGRYLFAGVTEPGGFFSGERNHVLVHSLDVLSNTNRPANRTVHDPVSSRAGQYSGLPSPPVALAAVGGHLAVGTFSHGLRILSVNRGTNLSEVATLPFTSISDIAVEGSMAFLLHEGDRISWVDLAAPAAPNWVGTHTNVVGLKKIWIHGGNLVALDASDVLRFFLRPRATMARRPQTIRLVTELPAQVHACWSIPGTNSPAQYFVNSPTLSLDATSDSGLPVQWRIAETASVPTNVVRAEINSSWNSTNLHVWPDRWTGSGMPNFGGGLLVYDGHNEGERLRVRLVASVPATPEFEAATLEREVEFDFSPRLEIRGLNRIQGTAGPIDVAQVRIPDILVQAVPPADRPATRMSFRAGAARFQVQYTTNLIDWTSLPSTFATGSGVVSVPLPVAAAAANLRLRRAD
jgi:hypothetical protein